MNLLNLKLEKIVLIDKISKLEVVNNKVSIENANIFMKINSCSEFVTKGKKEGSDV